MIHTRYTIYFGCLCWLWHGRFAKMAGNGAALEIRWLTFYSAIRKLQAKSEKGRPPTSMAMLSTNTYYNLT